MYGYMPILDVYAREILDSGGNAAIEVEIMTEDGTVGRAAVPSDVSDDRCGVCLHYINSVLAEMLIGENVYEQAFIDRLLWREMCVYPAKKKKGSWERDMPCADKARTNGIRCVSMAVAVTAANTRNLPLYRYLGGMCANRLPVPAVTLINWHGYLAGNGISADIREFMIVPIGARTCEEGIRMCAKVYHTLNGMLADFIPTYMAAEDVFGLLLEAVQKAGYQSGKEIAFAIDVAADERFDETSGNYRFPGESTSGDHEFRRSKEEMIEWLARLSSSYPIVSIANGLAGSDREGWEKLDSRFNGDVLLVKDAVSEAGYESLSEKDAGSAGQMAGKIDREKTAIAVQINISQSNTLTELLKKIEKARNGGREIVLTCGSSETDDTSLADLAVAVGAAQIRAGMPCHLECTAKYNRLLRIEDDLGLSVVYSFK